MTCRSTPNFEKWRTATLLPYSDSQCDILADCCLLLQVGYIFRTCSSWLRQNPPYWSLASFITAGLTKKKTRRSAGSWLRSYHHNMLAAQKTGLTFRSSYFCEIGMSAKSVNICTMRKLPVIWYCHGLSVRSVVFRFFFPLWIRDFPQKSHLFIPFLGNLWDIPWSLTLSPTCLSYPLVTVGSMEQKGTSHGVPHFSPVSHMYIPFLSP